MIALYSAIGGTLIHYAVDVSSSELEYVSKIDLHDDIQYVWAHPTDPFVYVVTGPREAGPEGGRYLITALAIDVASGRLTKHGEARPLPSRPIHVCVDGKGEYALTAFNQPSCVTVHRIDADGKVGELVTQSSELDTGIFAHQVRVAPSGNKVILVTRGNSATATRSEDPGALKLFDFVDGKLFNLASVAPNGGYGFGPRHIDFHPTKPWIYVSLERQNLLQFYRWNGEIMDADPVATMTTLAEPDNIRARQLAGTIHVHPSGKFVYVANRADATVDWQGQEVFAGGENSIAVFAIDPQSGEPRLIQHIDTHSIYVRTFSIDPSGTLLIAASTRAMLARIEDEVQTVPAALSMFRIGDDGTLAYLGLHPVNSGEKQQTWAGMLKFDSRRLTSGRASQ